MTEQILVTGGAGFIGSAIARRALDAGFEVVVVDNLFTGKRSSVPDSATFLEFDLSEKEALEKLDRFDIEAVFHLAGQSSGEKSFDDPEYDLNSHVMSTFNLLQWCYDHGVDRFLYASSMSVYGDPEYLPVDERHPVDPKTYYAAGKLSAEAYVQLFDNLGMNTTIFRLFSVFGPGQNMENMKQGMVSIYLSFVIEDETLVIRGPMDRFRDFVYIDDVVDIWIAAYGAPETWGKIYNVASGERTTVETLVDKMLRCYGVEEYPIEVADGTPGDQFGIYGDASKLKSDLGWTPTVSLNEGLDQMIAAHTD